MIVSPHDTQRSLEFELLKWIVLVALASLLIIGLASHTTGVASTSEVPQKVFIVSHWNGIFRAADTPGGLPYVEVGSRVEPGTIVGQVEELMVDGQPRAVAVPAGVTGTITHVLVEDGEMVLVGQALFEVRLDEESVAGL